MASPARPPEFIDAKFQTKIREYLAANISEDVKPPIDYTSTVSGKIEQVCQSWKDEIQQAASRGDYTHTLSQEKTNSNKRIDCHLDSPLITLISDQFSKKLSISYEVLWSGCPAYKNGILDSLPIATQYQIKFLWTPDNPHLYPSTPRYTYTHDLNAKKHLALAQQNQGTDCTIVCKSGEAIEFHSLYLNNHSDYFIAPNDKEINVDSPKQTVEMMREFIYLGQITPTLSELELIELAMFASQCRIKDLYNYCFDLLINHTNNTPNLTNKNLRPLLTFAITFKEESLLIACLKAAERLESNTEITMFEKMDWTKYQPSLLVRLLILANRQSLPVTEKKISEAIAERDAKISDIQNTSASIKPVE